ncbi:unnamed protein product [Blepharisma stoltei]|uniref:Uncharacterized protein n=1 Tax=Blepharisma stoltei TaxID=1481888 RepID=A0AAU9IWN8_9CILI|nr:unnamed protein product [Blepharisma stoltei]
MEALQCRFLDHIPSEIQDFSILNDYCLVLFNDSKLHLYRTSSWTLLHTFPGTQSLSLRKVRFHDSSHFISAGTSGALILWNLYNPAPLEIIQVPGSGIWDISKANSDYALAGDDGILRLYEIEEDHFNHSFLFQRQIEEKLLSVIWYDEFIFTGTHKGNIIKFRKGKSSYEDRLATRSAVWSLCAIGKFLASGEANGHISLWDPIHGTQFQTIKSHDADILCMCELDGNLYGSGVDSKVVKISWTGHNWVVAGKIRGQSHDVRALAACNNTIISGGVTSDICVYTLDLFENEGNMMWNNKIQHVIYKKKPIRHISTLPYTSPVSICKTHQGIHILHNKSSSLDLWQIDTQAQTLSKIISLIPKSKSSITCSAISYNSQILVYSTLYSFKVIQLSLEELKAEYIKTNIKPCSELALSGDFLFTGGKSMQFVNIKTMEIIDVMEFHEDLVVKMNSKGKWCAVILASNRVLVFKEAALICELPRLEKSITAVGFGHRKRLYLVTEDNFLHGYNMKTQEPDPYTHKYGHKLPKNFLNEANKVIGIEYFPKNSLILYTHYSFTYIDLSKKPPKRADILVKNSFPEHSQTWQGVLNTHPLHSDRKQGSTIQVKDLVNFAINKRFGPILSLNIMKSEMVVTELAWENILEVKPKPIAQHRYGS